MAKLDGKVAIITGASGGIGRDTAALFLEEGASVVLVDLDQAALDEAAAELSASGGRDRILVCRADVTSEDAVQGYVAAAREQFGHIDVFFNNAGIEGRVAPIAEQDMADFDKVMAVNVRGVFLGLKYVLPVMIEAGGGSVINMSSVAGLGGSPGVGPYVASKHAVAGLTKVAALEAASAGVRVNSVHPSPVNTRMMRSLEEGMGPGEPESIKDELTQTIPLGRYGEPRDVAATVLFLASDESAFLTGVQLRIDGGMGAK